MPDSDDEYYGDVHFLAKNFYLQSKGKLSFKMKTAGTSPEDKISADEGLISSITGWAFNKGIKEININEQKGRFVEITFNRNAQTKLAREFSLLFEDKVKSVIGPYVGWITLSL